MMSICGILLYFLIILRIKLSISEENVIDVSSLEIKKLNHNVNPCDNFYEFVCGNWINSTDIPDDKSSVDTFTTISNKVNIQLKLALEEQMLPKEIRAFQLTKTLYKSCLNNFQNESTKSLLKIIDELGGWPVLHSNWNDKTFDWKNITYINRATGFPINHFLEFSINADLKNNTKRIINFDAFSSSLREYLVEGIDNTVVQAYYKYMVDIAVHFGANETVAREELKQSLNFEIELANICLSSEERRNRLLTYNPMTVAELSNKYPSIPWLDYINKILHPFLIIDENELINIADPQYIYGLERLLNKTSKKIQANYVIWKLIFDSITYLNDETKNIELEFLKIQTGVVKRKARWEECISIVSNKMPLSVSALYVRKYVDKETKKAVTDIVFNIRKKIRTMIHKTNWIDNETRAMALNKVDAMNDIIAYPDELLDDKKLEKYYQDLNITPENLLQSGTYLTMFDMNHDIKRLRQPFNRTDWIHYGNIAASVDAYYDLHFNNIILPAAFLQDLFFDKTKPKYMNYGSLGFAVGHEIIHAFDDQGHLFDAVGNYANWWKTDTEKKFFKKIQCFIDQYGNYMDKSTGLKLNSINTQGENVADNVGMKAAYLAYKDWAKDNKLEPKLLGLDYKPEQLFWISVANFWCKKQRDEDLRNTIKTDYHSPNEFRIIGTMSNMPEFATDFKCTVGSPMNPKYKCSF